MIPFKFDLIGPDRMDYFGKSVNDAHIAGLEAVAKYWHENMLPKHFLRNASATYLYQRRRPRYVRAKNNKPSLVYTGDTQRAATAPPTIRATAKRLTLQMDLPDYIRTRRMREPGPILESINQSIAQLRARAAEASALGQPGKFRSILKRIEQLESQVQKLNERAKTSANYPPIQDELTRTLASEYDTLRAVYIEAGKNHLDQHGRRRPTR